MFVSLLASFGKLIGMFFFSSFQQQKFGIKLCLFSPAVNVNLTRWMECQRNRRRRKRRRKRNLKNNWRYLFYSSFLCCVFWNMYYVWTSFVFMYPQSQSQLIWGIKDKLRKCCSINDMKELLIANGQSVPSGESNVRETHLLFFFFSSLLYCLLKKALRNLVQSCFK